MSAARPVSPAIVLVALILVAGLGFWNGFSDSLASSGGLKGCISSNANTITGPNGAPVPLATPIAVQPAPAEEVKPAEPKKKADATKTEDPGTATHDLAPLPKATPPADDSTAPATATSPSKPPPEPEPAQQPPY